MCLCGAAALIPARRLVPTEPAGDCAVQGLIVIVCARVSALSHCNPQEYCKLPAKLIRLSESLWPNFSQNKHAAEQQKGRRAAAATWCSAAPSQTREDPHNATPLGQATAESGSLQICVIL